MWKCKFMWRRMWNAYPYGVWRTRLPRRRPKSCRKQCLRPPVGSERVGYRCPSPHRAAAARPCMHGGLTRRMSGPHGKCIFIRTEQPHDTYGNAYVAWAAHARNTHACKHGSHVLHEGFQLPNGRRPINAHANTPGGTPSTGGALTTATTGDSAATTCSDTPRVEATQPREQWDTHKPFGKCICVCARAYRARRPVSGLCSTRGVRHPPTRPTARPRRRCSRGARIRMCISQHSDAHIPARANAYRPAPAYLTPRVPPPPQLGGPSPQAREDNTRAQSTARSVTHSADSSPSNPGPPKYLRTRICICPHGRPIRHARARTQQRVCRLRRRPRGSHHCGGTGPRRRHARHRRSRP